MIQSVMGKAMYKGRAKTLSAFDSKSFYTIFVRGCGIIPAGKIQDPKIAYWLLDPGAKEKNLHGMVHNYLPTEGGILEGKKDSISYAVKSFFKPKAVTILQRNILFDQVCQWIVEGQWFTLITMI